MSGCKSGYIAQSILKNEYEDAKQMALKYKNEFGDNFYLELQNFKRPQDDILKANLLKISKETKILPVATNNVHYIKKEDRLVKDLVTCIKNASLIDKELVLKGSLGERYLKSYDEMREVFFDCEDAVKNTLKIADECEFKFEFGRINIPKFEAFGVEDNKKFLKETAKKGLILKYGDRLNEKIKERFEYELDVIVKMGFVDYFLIVYDYVKYVKDKGIFVGPGRGSSAGSLISYCLDITQVDPIKYDLSFERFLNQHRSKMPDFDVDFCNERRQEVIDYVIKKYGKDRVARIISFGSLAAKAAVRDVGRVLGLEYEFVDLLVKKMPFKIGFKINDILNSSDELQSVMATNEDVALVFETAKKVEGLFKNTSTHAAAVVMTRERLDNYIPLYKVDDVVTTQYDMDDIELLNFLKMDFLGLRNLTILEKAERLINKKDKNFKLNLVSLDDEKTYHMLAKGDTVGVFQLESYGMRNVLKKVKPNCLEDVMDVIALNRPGPAQFIDLYVQNKKKPDEIVYLNDVIKRILSKTYGVIVYQEQVMKIFRDVGGYSFKRIDTIRKEISKKKFDEMKKEEDIFLYGKKDEDADLNCDGAIKNGVSEKVARKIFSSLLRFSSYAFNRAHAASYAIISYKTAYLKCNFLLEYMVCLLNSVIDNKDKLKIYLKECEDKKIKILPLDVNYSDTFFKIENDNAIRFSFLAVKNVSRNFSDLIVKERINGLYGSFYDFLSRIIKNNVGLEFNRTAVLTLASKNCFKNLKIKGDLTKAIDDILNEIKFKKKEIKGQISLFSKNEPDKTTHNTYKNAFKKELILKGVIKNILVKTNLDGTKTYVLQLGYDGKTLNILMLRDKFFEYKNLIKIKSLVKIFAIKIQKNNKTLLLLNKLKTIKLTKALFIKTSEMNEMKLKKVIKILKENEGEDLVFFMLKEKRKIFRSKDILGVKISEKLTQDLKKAIGEENLYFKEIDIDEFG